MLQHLGITTINGRVFPLCLQFVIAFIHDGGNTRRIVMCDARCLYLRKRACHFYYDAIKIFVIISFSHIHILFPRWWYQRYTSIKLWISHMYTRWKC